MFKKCLKYDLMSIRSVWWTVAAAVTGVGWAGCVCLRLFIEQIMDNSAFAQSVLGVVTQVLLMITAALSFGAVIAFLVLTPVLVFIRFYRNFFTDEGYLTFTLPVSRRTLYLSKTISALIWTIASVAVFAVVVLFGMLVIPPTDMHISEQSGLGQATVGPFNLVAFEAVGQAMMAIWQAVGGWTVLYFLEALAGVILTVLFEIGVIQMCITVGSAVAEKHKLIASVGIYFGVSSAVSSASSVLLTLAEFMILPGAEYVVSETVTIGRLCAMAAAVGLAVNVILAILCCVIHFIALGNVERRLNLA